jgi:magnesium transporter
LQPAGQRLKPIAACNSFPNFPVMNLEKLRPEKYLKYLNPTSLFATKRTKEILSANPTIMPHREEADAVAVTVFDYNAESLEEKKLTAVGDCFMYKTSGRTTWINIDGLRKADVDAVCTHFDIHPLIIEDILSINQRPKMDEADNSIFCLLNMLYYNEEKHSVEQEQISIILAKDVVISVYFAPGKIENGP